MTRDDPRPHGVPRGGALALAFVFALVTARADAASELRLDGDVAVRPRLFGSPRYASFGLGATFVGSTFELGAGVRLLLGDLATLPGLSAYLRAMAFARAGFLRPAIGVELEASSATGGRHGSSAIEGSLTAVYESADRGNVLRTSVILAPLRASFGPVFVSIAALGIGTPLSSEVGKRVYLTLSVLDLGWTL